ncbi:MAG TPA: YiiX/YebB-like N1pC/P60 family cysteine hydrolase [Bradyrhizobium sp.]|nr:YiiX/YebB-like N1pC/P60 family cysteine hydrolase [Bradyrhizobium sp.]
MRLLTKPLKQYVLKIPNDLTKMERYIRKGDVVLVEGNERISEVIKYLTQSSWSHAALYVGDEPLKRDPALRKELLEKFGDDANHLLVEALVERGVVLTPLSSYRHFNIRICRPYNLSREHARQVIDDALSKVGNTYDVKNILDLARYFLPVTLVPRRFRRTALRFGSGEPTRVICSSMIADSFDRVKFPIVPNFKEPPLLEETEEPRRLRRLFARPDGRRFGVFQSVSPTLITPRDFDLSPYFEVVKFNIIEGLHFDYRKLVWADEQASEVEKSA